MGVRPDIYSDRGDFKRQLASVGERLDPQTVLWLGEASVAHSETFVHSVFAMITYDLYTWHFLNRPATLGELIMAGKHDEGKLAAAGQYLEECDFVINPEAYLPPQLINSDADTRPLEVKISSHFHPVLSGLIGKPYLEKSPLNKKQAELCIDGMEGHHRVNLNPLKDPYPDPSLIAPSHSQEHIRMAKVDLMAAGFLPRRHRGYQRLPGAVVKSEMAGIFAPNHQIEFLGVMSPFIDMVEEMLKVNITASEITDRLAHGAGFSKKTRAHVREFRDLPKVIFNLWNSDTVKELYQRHTEMEMRLSEPDRHITRGQVIFQ